MAICARAALLGAAVLVSVSGQAHAQSRSSFLSLDALSGLTITQDTSVKYTVQLGAAPTLTYLGVTYTINSMFGFWAVSNLDNDFADTTSFGTWDAHESLSGTGGISGWKTNPNQGTVPGGSQSFTFDRLVAADVATFGMHLRTNEQLPTGGNTAYFLVPAPGPAALLGLSALVMPRRRR